MRVSSGKLIASTLSVVLMVSIGPVGAAIAADVVVDSSPSSSGPSLNTAHPEPSASPDAASPTSSASPSASAEVAGEVPGAVAEVPVAGESIEARAAKRLKANQRKIAKSRIVWGFASTGHAGPVRGGKVSVRSIRNKPLKANVITKKTNKRGFYAVSRLGIPKRFVVVITGGKVRTTNGGKSKVRATKATLLAPVAKPKRGLARHTVTDVTLGTTVAALTGVKKYRNAGDARAAKRARKALRLPPHAALGTYDRLLPHYVNAQKVRSAATQRGSLTKVINTLVKQASRNRSMNVKLGAGVRTKFRVKSEGSEVSARNSGRIGTRSLDDSADVLSETVAVVQTAYPYVAAGISLFKLVSGLFNSGPNVGAELAAINQQLTQMNKELNGIQTQLTTIQDEMETEFAEVSLQLSKTDYDVLAASGTIIASQANSAMQQMQLLSNIATPSYSSLLPGQIAEVNGLLANLSQSAASATLQRELIGGNNSPGILGSLWELIGQSRGVAAPAMTANPTAVTTLLTHENYDAFAPAATQWYLAQVQLSILMTNYTMTQDLVSAHGQDTGSVDGWVFSGGSYQMTQAAEQSYNVSMNGICSSSPCPGSFNSYLNVLADSMPSKTLGSREAVDTTTGLKWGNFGIVNWNAAATKPDPSSADLIRPPSVTVTCDGQSKLLVLDEDFFKTVNGTDSGCSWPGAPTGGPIGSNDSASDWQMLTSDPGSNGTYGSTLGNLTANIKSGGTGLLGQIDNSTTVQRANPSLNIAGVNAADFTSPSLFPDTGWGRFVYSKGPWSQFMWNDDGTARHAGRPLFPWHNTVPARTSAGDFLVFDILNPTAPSLAATPFRVGCTAGWKYPPAGFTVPGCIPGSETDFSSGNPGAAAASLIASDLPWAGYANSWDYEAADISDPGPSSRSFQSDIGYAFKDSNDPSQRPIAGLAAPWWPSANFSHNGDENSSLPATPGCSNSMNRPWQGVDFTSSAFAVGDTCSASVIGTRQVTVSDYEWQQPQSIG